jgi:tRNA threonylcarbamoyladenosine biosynthesis protein TsaE
MLRAPIMTLALADESQTLDLGARLGARVVGGDFIALTGPLGAGKTTLARGLIRAFVGAPVDVPSPTFTLVQTYTKDNRADGSASDSGYGLDLFHFDLYRLQSPEEVWELGWEDLSSAVALVEWPDKAQQHLPPDRLDIELSFDGTARVAQFFASNGQVWKDRLDGVDR